MQQLHHCIVAGSLPAYTDMSEAAYEIDQGEMDLYKRTTTWSAELNVFGAAQRERERERERVYEQPLQQSLLIKIDKDGSLEVWYGAAQVGCAHWSSPPLWTLTAYWAHLRLFCASAGWYMVQSKKGRWHWRASCKYAKSISMLYKQEFSGVKLSPLLLLCMHFATFLVFITYIMKLMSLQQQCQS